MHRTLAVTFAALLAAPLLAEEVRAQVVRWLPPSQPVDGYRVYVAPSSMTFTVGTDIGFVAPDTNGEAARDLSDLVPPDGGFVVMTAYDGTLESIFSNEIHIEAEAPDPEPEPDPDPLPDPEPPALPGGSPTPPPEDPVLVYAEDFESYRPGQDPDGWLDTSPGEGWIPDPELFQVFELPDGNLVFGTESEEPDVHSHYLGDEAAAFYEVRGRLRIDNLRAKAGVTVYSGYPDDPHYYRLQRTKRAFKIEAVTRSRTRCQGDRKVEIAANPETWYRFRFQATGERGGTRLRASVWLDGTPPPEEWMADCLEKRGLRTGGAMGLWSRGRGAKYWDELEILRVQKSAY